MNPQKKRILIIITSILLVIVAVVFIICGIAAIVTPISVWLGLGAYGYSTIYMAGASKNYCVKHKMFDEGWESFSDCECVPPSAPAYNFTRYRISPERITNVEFAPRDDEWKANGMPNLRASLISYDNFTEAPTIVLVHGIRVCRKICTSMIVAGMLHNAGYNIIAMDLRNHGESPETSPPYTQFGNQEYMDVLGAVDYLEQKFGSNITNTLGLTGHSMGGATSIIAYAKEKKFKALFLDSPVCDVYKTLYDNVNRATKTTLARSILRAGCLLKKTYSCAPFENDPLENIKTVVGRPVHFDHCTSDTLVPVFSSNHCSQLMLKNPLNQGYVSKYVSASGYPFMEKCSDHLHLMFTQPILYEQRLTQFFDTHLKQQ